MSHDLSKSGNLKIAESTEEPKRILIIEDSPEDLFLMSARLSNLHASIDNAADLESAYRVIRESKPDIVILDVGIPPNHGTGTHASMEDLVSFVLHHRGEQCMVIVTGNTEASESDIRLFYGAGAVDYIGKDTVNLGLEFVDRVKRAFKAYNMLKSNLPAAQVMVQLAKGESRQDKLFWLLKRVHLQMGEWREADKKATHEQAFKAGREFERAEYSKKWKRRAAAIAGSISFWIGLGGMIWRAWHPSKE